MFCKGIAFSELQGRLCDGNVSSPPPWYDLDAPLFCDRFSTPLVSEAATAAGPLPSQPSHHGAQNWATQHTNMMEGKPEPSRGFTQYSLNRSNSGTA